MLCLLMKRSLAANPLKYAKIVQNGLHSTCQLSESHKAKRIDKTILKSKYFNVYEMPVSATLLGFAGAVPFIAMSMSSGVFGHSHGDIALYQISYSACILTFLGAVHWGKEITRQPHEPSYKVLTYSVLPSLYAWSAFFLLPDQQLALYYLSLGLAGVAVYDVTDASLPNWYRQLRIPLTLMASFSVAITGYYI